MSLLNWIKRSPRKNNSPKRKTGKPAQISPLLESLEARQLLTGSIAAPTISSGWQTGTNITIPSGRTLQIPLSDTTTAGKALTYSVTSSNPNVVATVHTGETFVDIKVGGGVTGEMVFELFNDLTPNTAAYIASTVQSGFYDSIIFHRVISGFVAQAGDPGGTGSYGPYGFADELNTQALFDGNGQLGMARSNHDTNSTQFFITQGPQRFLDLNYTMFGQLVSGFDTFTQIMSTPTNKTTDKPTTDITITSATVIQDTTHAVISLASASGTPNNSTTTVTVSTTDGTNTSPSTTFQVTALTDTSAEPPFLNLAALPTYYTTPVNTPISINVPVTSADGTTYTVSAGIIDSTSNAKVVVTQLPGSNVVKITPNAGYTGVLNVEIQVSGAASTSADAHDIVIGVGAQPLVVTNATSTGLVAGASPASITVASFTDADAIPASNFSASIVWGDGKAETVGTVVKNSDGSYSVSGTNSFANPGTYTGILTISSSTGAGISKNLSITVIPAQTNLDHQKYVTQLYTDLLGRTVDAAGLASWSGLLNSGTTYAQVAIAITSSREYDGIVVDKFYFDYLGRHAETAGLNAWVDQMQTGLNAEVIRAGILGSDEYYNRTGPGNMNGTDATFITALYQTFLNRSPDAGGLAAWEGLLGGVPAKRQTVAKGISNSDENRTVIITGFFQTYLHRSPDAGGLAAWKNLLAEGISQPQIISAFVTSPEYLGRLGITG